MLFISHLKPTLFPLRIPLKCIQGILKINQKLFLNPLEHDFGLFWNNSEGQILKEWIVANNSTMNCVSLATAICPISRSDSQDIALMILKPTHFCSWVQFALVLCYYYYVKKHNTCTEMSSDRYWEENSKGKIGWWRLWHKNKQVIWGSRRRGRERGECECMTQGYSSWLNLH